MPSTVRRAAGQGEPDGAPQIVKFAEYEDTDGGQRYFLAIVTSCKDLNAICQSTRVLQQKVEGRCSSKRLSIFSFAEYYSNGQWATVLRRTLI